MALFIGIDVSLEKHNCCIVNEQERILSEFCFPNNCSGYTELLDQIRQADDRSGKKCIGLEATGVYGNSLTAFLRRNGFDVMTLNPLSVKKQLTATTLRKTKTDKSDARFIAVLLARGSFQPDTLPSYHISQLKSLSRRRFSLVKKRSGSKNQVKALLIKLFPEYISFFSDVFGATSLAVLSRFPSASELASCRPSALTKIMQSVSRGRFGSDDAKKLISLAKSSVGVYSYADSVGLSMLLEEIEFYNRQISRIEGILSSLLAELHSPISTVPGIGVVLASMILAEIGNINRFSNPNKLLAFSGLDPSIYQSGKFSPSSGSMVKRGSPYLRWALLLAARIIPLSSSSFSDYQNKKRSEGKHYNVVSSHVAKKLVRVLFSILKNNVPFHD